jgi:cysteinyl-tRNA synthetase
MQAALEQMTLSKLLNNYSGELLRYFVLSTHYRRPIEYSTEEIAAKRKGLNSFYRLFERVERVCGQSVYGDAGLESAAPGGADPAFAEEIGQFRTRFLESMDDDFNTAAAIAVLFEQANAINRFIEMQKLEHPEGEAGRPTALWAGRQLVSLARLLGLFLEPQVEAATAAGELAEKVLPLLVDLRAQAKTKKDFATADLIRDRLADAGVTLVDRPGKTVWRIKRAVDDLCDRAMRVAIEVRAQAKNNKDFATADLIRDQLAEVGITLEDRPDGAGWRKS